MYSQLKKYYTGAALNGGWAMPLDVMNSATVPSDTELVKLGNATFSSTSADAQDKITKAQAKYGATWNQVFTCIGLLLLMDSYALRAATDRDYGTRQLAMQRARALKNVYGHVAGSTIFRRIRSIFHNNKSAAMGLAADQGPYAPFSSRLVPSIGKYYRFLDGNKKMKLMRGLSWNVPSLISQRHANMEARRKQRMRDLWTAINARREELGLPKPKVRKGPTAISPFDPRWQQIFNLAEYPGAVEKDVKFDPFSVIPSSPDIVMGTPDSVDEEDAEPEIPGTKRPAASPPTGQGAFW